MRRAEQMTDMCGGASKQAQMLGGELMAELMTGYGVASKQAGGFTAQHVTGYGGAGELIAELMRID